MLMVIFVFVSEVICICFVCISFLIFVLIFGLRLWVGIRCLRVLGCLFEIMRMWLLFERIFGSFGVCRSFLIV